MKQTERGEFLIRGDSCIFLTTQGLCTLYNNQTKPLICETFPLIFWKINPDEYLSWIHPCGRGSGFQWVIEPEKQISDNQISEMYRKTKNHFKTFWGEQIDSKNPFDEISIERVKQEQEFFRGIEEGQLFEGLLRFGETNFPSSPVSSLSSLVKNYLNQSELIQTESAVLHWLSWSPVGLQLSFLNAKLVFLTAALWISVVGSTQRASQIIKDGDFQQWIPESVIKLNDSRIPPKTKSTFPQTHINRQLGSLLATAMLPSFWGQIVSQTIDHNLQSFAKVVQAVLTGRTPQQELHQFIRL
jgi:hypothetical protein